MPGFFRQIKDYFGFSRTEVNGMYFLCVLIFLLILVNIFAPYFIKHKPVNQQAFTEWVSNSELMKSQKPNSETAQTDKIAMNNEDEKKLTPFYFDPNNLPVEIWVKMGLSESQIKVIKNYEAKGGHFKKPEDLEKIYSISAEEYKILKPFIQITETPVENEKQEIELNLFAFDPNKISREEFESLGLEPGLIDIILNYRNKGGLFKGKSDFAKIYGLSEELYIKLEPYISIASDTLPNIDLTAKIPSLLININTADTLDLQQLPGIGPSFAQKIVKYRELLGGYYSSDQLLEVYGMDSLRFTKLSKNIFCTGEIRQININTATIKEMIKHPYIEYYLAKSIITHRQTSGKYVNLHSLLDNNLVYPELFQKISPYLCIEK
ncbi:MAG: helix-hairpin-helix domain-containing protein [Bacteroidales bacterium]|nr:helix-hairpin-helix domain-containing protein [Bacteroidales bacterium]MCF8404407.1 helix-hairpin-helix domain-containing protein [Bacteroidales bacterium]